ncbi:GNAT family N-acetyltransferase [Roseococcus microcysteis]|uniref:GNAT family N-acetyltransferase n=1 Tax=Roseococcus microcysteis TaxID=2771361 RepID=UPI00168B9C07|nr:GNAT family N-acetyltransferase [Roseococcus microcysteis]
MTIQELDATAAEAALPALSEILHGCVHGGASVGFILPFAVEDAAHWWRAKVLPAVAAGERRLLVASRAGRILGTAQLDLATPPNQRHRAEVCKVLVRPDSRRQGLGRALMQAMEPIARAEGRSLLTLDTVAGSAAQPLYESLGYVLVGVLPGWARAAREDRLEGTAIMYKRLA